jgi:hypothetical protein
MNRANAAQVTASRIQLIVVIGFDSDRRLPQSLLASGARRARSWEESSAPPVRGRDVPESRSSATYGFAQLAAPVLPGGPSSTVGTYSNSWRPPSKVRLSTRSSLTSGYPS